MEDIEDNIEICDSDDELLGITDNPIDIRSLRGYNHSIYRISPNKPHMKSTHVFNSNNNSQEKYSPYRAFAQSISSPNNDGWVYRRNNRRTRDRTYDNYNKYRPSASGKVNNSVDNTERIFSSNTLVSSLTESPISLRTPYSILDTKSTQHRAVSSSDLTHNIDKSIHSEICPSTKSSEQTNIISISQSPNILASPSNTIPLFNLLISPEGRSSCKRYKVGFDNINSGQRPRLATLVPVEDPSSLLPLLKSVKDAEASFANCKPVEESDILPQKDSQSLPTNKQDINDELISSTIENSYLIPTQQGTGSFSVQMEDITQQGTGSFSVRVEDITQQGTGSFSVQIEDIMQRHRLRSTNLDISDINEQMEQSSIRCDGLSQSKEIPFDIQRQVESLSVQSNYVVAPNIITDRTSVMTSVKDLMSSTQKELRSSTASRIDPRMEIIDANNYNTNDISGFFESRWEEKPFYNEYLSLRDSGLAQRSHRYQRMREIHGVIGFIVNVHDATNFDIDLEISPEIHEKYGDVISNQYTYQDLNNNFFETHDLNKLIQAPSIGTTYRCRLRGVGINQLSQYTHTWKSNQMCVEVKQLIDRTDGWITCTLSDIDVYQRLLVDIIVNTCRGPINLRDYLLTRMEEDDHRENPIFYPYSGKKKS